MNLDRAGLRRRATARRGRSPLFPRRTDDDDDCDVDFVRQLNVGMTRRTTKGENKDRDKHFSFGTRHARRRCGTRQTWMTEGGTFGAQNGKTVGRKNQLLFFFFFSLLSPARATQISSGQRRFLFPSCALFHLHHY